MEFTRVDKRKTQKRLSEIRMTSISFDKSKRLVNPYANMKGCINMKRRMDRPNSKIQRSGNITKIIFEKKTDSFILRNSEGLALGIIKHDSEMNFFFHVDDLKDIMQWDLLKDNPFHMEISIPTKGSGC